MRIAQVGARGFGRVHLARVDRMADLGRAELVAIADPAGPLDDRTVPWYPSLGDLLAAHEVDIVQIATPIGTHMAIATEALRAGADVVLEKPPVASLADFYQLVRTRDETGRAVQIGFQSLGSDAIERMAEIAASELGELQQVQVYGSWTRTKAYFQRSAWAGKRRMNGARVADGVGTNALAHSIATACAIVGLTDIADVEQVETELYHAHPTESDDTSWYRIVRHSGVPITAALTLVAPSDSLPTVTLVGSDGTAELAYTVDDITVTVADSVRREHTDRTDLLENLVDHREHGTALRVPLERTLGYMTVLEATQDRQDPVQIDDEYLTWEGEGDDAHPLVTDLDLWMRRSLQVGAGFFEVGAPWARADAADVWKP
jgi:predicted dehydrogenase